MLYKLSCASCLIGFWFIFLIFHMYYNNRPHTYEREIEKIVTRKKIIPVKFTTKKPIKKAPITMKASQNAIDLIKKWEGYSALAYKDVGGIWTVGYGHTEFVREGDYFNPDEAEIVLKKDLEFFEKKLNSYLTVKLNQNQFDSLVSLMYNIGHGAFRESTIREYLNTGQITLVPNEFKRWNKVAGKIYAGLRNRRIEEINLFMKPMKWS